MGSAGLTTPEFSGAQPILSVTVTLYVPGHKLFAVAEVWVKGSSHKKVYGGKPPTTLTVACPSQSPGQLASCGTTVVSIYPKTVIQNEKTCDPKKGQLSSTTLTVKH
jgi:hypothetical protein